MRNDIIFRLVSEADAPEILNIYAPYVTDTVISFEYEVPSVTQFQDRIRSISAEYPYIVCLSGDKIVGYAYGHRYIERAAYQWNAELAVYIDKDWHGAGIGKKVYGALIEILKLQNVKTVYGCITSQNEKSIGFHKALGFTEVGTYHKTGYKCGRWLDVAWLEKTIGEYSSRPEPFVPFCEINRTEIEKILDEFFRLIKMPTSTLNYHQRR